MQACLQLFTCCFEFIARERATKQMRQRLRVGIASCICEWTALLYAVTTSEHLRVGIAFCICEWTALLYLRGFLCRITPTNTI